MLAGVIQGIGQMNALSLLWMANQDSHFMCSMSFVGKIFRALPEVQFSNITQKAMEGYGVKMIMEELKRNNFNVTQIVHDRDASTLKQVMEVYQDVEECLCLCKFFPL